VSLFHRADVGPGISGQPLSAVLFSFLRQCTPSHEGRSHAHHVAAKASPQCFSRILEEQILRWGEGALAGKERRLTSRRLEESSDDSGYEARARWPASKGLPCVVRSTSRRKGRSAQHTKCSVIRR
jgi:hypothetical protein